MLDQHNVAKHLSAITNRRSLRRDFLTLAVEIGKRAFDGLYGLNFHLFPHGPVMALRLEMAEPLSGAPSWMDRPFDAL